MTQKDNTVQAKLVGWDNPQKVTFVWGPRQAILGMQVLRAQRPPGPATNEEVEYLDPILQTRKLNPLLKLTMLLDVCISS